MSKKRQKIVFIFCLPFMAGLIYSVGRPVLVWLRTFAPNIPSVPFWLILSLLMSSITLSYMLPYGKLSSALHLIGEAFFPVNVLLISLVLPAAMISLFYPNLPLQRTGNIICIIFLFINIAGILNAFRIREKHYELSIEKEHGPLRIALISDLHLGFFSDKGIGLRIARAVVKTNPDVVIIAGDIFDDRYEMLRNREEIVSDLKAMSVSTPVYACEGNHDLFCSSAEAREFLKDAGITLLQDKKISYHGYELLFRRDYKSERKTHDEIMNLTDKSKPVIVVDHNPKDSEKLISLGADVTLSGHTHAGQTFPGNILYKLLPMQSYGLKRQGHGNAIVTSGIGFYGIPVRFGVNSEVAVIDIK